MVGPGKGWSKGKTYEEIYGLERKLVITDKQKKAALNREPPLQKTREKLSEAAKRNGLGGYRPGIGRGRRGRYKGIWCDSSWELAYVIFNLDHKVEFRRNKKAFVYRFDGKESRFYPDFVLSDDTYVEIKGYWSDRFNAKVCQFPGKILIICRDEMTPYLKYVEYKYGKNFTYLYETALSSESIKNRCCIECNKQISKYSKTGRCLRCAVVYRYKLRGPAEKKRRCNREEKHCKMCNKLFYPPTKKSLFCSYGCAHKASRRFDVSFDELYNLVWSLPITEVAKRLGVSNVAVIKRCNLLKIKRPPQGFWLKKSNGEVGEHG